MALIRVFIVLLCFSNVFCELCPKQCDCDLDNDLNRARCVDQNIIDIDVGVPKEVQIYSLSHNALSELDNFCFKESGYTAIQVLDLSYNLIFWIGLHAFSGLDKLYHLDLSNNRLRYIPSDLLWDTPDIETLDLSGNVFESLKNEPFIMQSKLQILNLNSCRIKALPDRLFSRLPNLKKLDLSENYMVSFSTEVLHPLRKLERLELRNQYWQCNPEFIAIEEWITSHGITYQKQCKRKLPKMSEKMISVVNSETEDVDIKKVWKVITDQNDTSLEATDKKKKLTMFEKFDKEFSSVQAFVIGIEIGLAIGIVATYIWLRNMCKCGHLRCTRPQTRRQRRRCQRIQRADSDMRSNLLWSSVINPNLDTPPSFRRELSLPDRSPPYPIYGIPIGGSSIRDASNLPDRAETPPPPYNECHVNII